MLHVSLFAMKEPPHTYSTSLVIYTSRRDETTTEESDTCSPPSTQKDRAWNPATTEPKPRDVDQQVSNAAQNEILLILNEVIIPRTTGPKQLTKILNQASRQATHTWKTVLILSCINLSSIPSESLR